jgi:nitrous oxidase accessory protein NosD
MYILGVKCTLHIPEAPDLLYTLAPYPPTRNCFSNLKWRITMRNFILSAFILLSVTLVRAPVVAAAKDGDRKPDLLVDGDKIQCPAATFTSIQDAINGASSGSVIRVCAGIYHEQLLINKSLTIEADNGAIVLPNSMLANATGSSGTPIAAAVLVKDAANVEIEGFIVDTANNGIAECAPILIGILYQNSSGSIKHNAVRNAKLSVSLNGCQSGDAIVVQSLGGGTSKVIIEGNSIHDYQKNGITGNELGTEVTISKNVVTGLGPTTGAAQNGIQIGFGAKGSVSRNTVADNVWSPCVSLTNCSFNATGILVFQSDDVLVEHNSVATNQVGVFTNGQNATIESNNISHSLVLVGIDLAGDDNLARHNDVANSGQAAILVEGNNNKVQSDKITEAPIGILKLSGTVGNILSGNSFFDTMVPVQDPVPAHVVHVAPQRQ